MNNPVVPALIDTEVVVAWSRGHPPASRFSLAVISLCAPRLSRLSAMEMLTVSRSDAERAIGLSLLATRDVLELTDTIARRALNVLTTIPLPSPLTAGDAIVAATALEHSLPLYTPGPGRFAAVPGLTAIQPY